MWRVVVLVFICGCGRLGFDPVAIDVPSSNRDVVVPRPDAADVAVDPLTDTGRPDTGLSDVGGDGFDALGVDASTCGLIPNRVGYWTMDRTDIAAGAVTDASGNGRDGTLVGLSPPVLVAGPKGMALDYAGSDIGYVRLPDLPFNTSDAGFNTVAMWFRSTDTDVDETLFYLPEGSGGAQRYDLWLSGRHPVGVSLCVNTGNGECWGVADPGLLNRWVHVVVAFANGRTDGSRFYIDGVPSEMACRFGTCDQTAVADNPADIGGSDDQYAFHGQIDDVQVFNRLLSEAEVAELYACASSEI